MCLAKCRNSDENHASVQPVDEQHLEENVDKVYLDKLRQCQSFTSASG